MSWALLRAAIILATGQSYASVITPPQPLPRPEERSRYQGLNLVVRSFQNGLTPAIIESAKAAARTVACADAVFTLAYVFRSTPIGTKVLHFLSQRPASPAISTSFLLGALAVAVGAYIRKQCYRELGKLFTYELSIRNDHKLVSSGPYAIVRHPSYTGLALLYAGLTVCGVSRGSWLVEAGILQTTAGKALAAFWSIILFINVAVISRVRKEDAMLRQEFGEEWEAYAKRVPYKFIPGVL